MTPEQERKLLRDVQSLRDTLIAHTGLLAAYVTQQAALMASIQTALHTAAGILEKLGEDRADVVKEQCEVHAIALDAAQAALESALKLLRESGSANPLAKEDLARN
ncbi:MAG TPA: hypothetical protein VNZ64_13615 [Candidatus Acidoferrum sp.]|nr:hypothetical protein [Candidatus Acidoferrum sp.]